MTMESKKTMADRSTGSVESKPTEQSITTSGRLVLKCSMPLESGLLTTSFSSANLTEISSGLKRATSPKTTGSSTTTTQSTSPENHAPAHHGSSPGETELRETKISPPDSNLTDGQAPTNSREASPKEIESPSTGSDPKRANGPMVSKYIFNQI